ncbi:unnamed protein product [Rotaria sordida]|uniref:Uncharacterized protein n=1 Tax=Rotaria sordida TaxID=392033 RepID=A0A813ZBF1_9BILA|nr:unnamed protein product [Rotaria sordida]
MISTEAQTKNQSQQSTTYDERVFNERIRQLFNSTDSTSVSSPNNNINQMTSIVDALFPEQASFYQQQQQQQQQQRDQRRSSTNDLTTAFDRFSLWNNNSNSSASAFCGETSNGSSTFTNRRQSTLHSSSRSLRNTYHHHQKQHHYRPPPVSRPRFPSSSIRIPSASTITAPCNNYTSGLQRSSSSLSTNNTSATMDYQPRFASRLSTTRLSSTAPVGSHDQIAGNNNTIDSIAPSSSIDVMDQTCSASAVLSRNTSTTNVQPQQLVTMTQTTTTTFCYVPASGSLVYNNLAGTGRSTTVSHH